MPVYYRYPLAFALFLSSLYLPLPVLAAETTADASERPIVNVEQDGRYRAVYDIHSDRESAGISRGLYYARGLVEAFGKQGVKPEQLDIHLVLHGDATKFLLIDETYQEVTLDPFNVNLTPTSPRI
ncbi:MAG: hypothetical protein R3E89_08825 [Thiolinea sp.]